MKRKYFVTIGIVATLLVPGVAYASSEHEPHGNAFSQLWRAITDLRTQVQNIQLIPGPKGDTGAQGPQGNPGPAGATAPVKLYKTNTTEAVILNSAQASHSWTWSKPTDENMQFTAKVSYDAYADNFDTGQLTCKLVDPFAPATSLDSFKTYAQDDRMSGSTATFKHNAGSQLLIAPVRSLLAGTQLTITCDFTGVGTSSAHIDRIDVFMSPIEDEYPITAIN